MRLNTKFTPAALLAFSALACSHKSNLKLTPDMVNTIDPGVIQQQAALEAPLAKRQITYNPNFRNFSSENLVEPCDPGLMSDFDAALQASNKLEDQLKPQADLYRDDALDFYRKVTAANDNLQEINDQLNKYCGTEFAPQVACFASTHVVLVRINENVANAGVLHPYLKLDKDSDVTLYMYQGDKLIRSQQGASTYARIAQVTSLAQLKTLSSCLADATKNSQTDLAKAVAETSAVSFSDVNNQCSDLQEKWKLQHIRAAEPAVNTLCGI